MTGGLYTRWQGVYIQHGRGSIYNMADSLFNMARGLYTTCLGVYIQHGRESIYNMTGSLYTT